MVKGYWGRFASLMVLLSLMISVFTTYRVNALPELKSEGSTVVYFYMSVCEICKDEEKFYAEVDEISRTSSLTKSPEIRIYNLIENSSFYALLDKYYEEYGVPKSEQITPIVFIGSSFYTGEDGIKEGLKRELSKLKPEETKLLQLTPRDSARSEERFSKMKAVNTLFFGFVNGFNPCSISMLLFFFSMLAAGDVNVKRMGFLFGLGKFIMYLLLGTVLFAFLARIQMGTYKLIMMLVFELFIGIIIFFNIRDFFAARREDYKNVKNQLPKTIRRFNHNIIKKFISKGNKSILMLFSLTLGIITSIGEFMCTGQVYLATIIYTIGSSSELNLRAFLYLLLYDIGFIIPLVIITVLISKGKELFIISEVFRRKLPVIKLISSAVLLIIGIITFLVFQGILNV